MTCVPRWTENPSRVHTMRLSRIEAAAMLSYLKRRIHDLSAHNDRVKDVVTAVAKLVGYDLRRWTRVVYNEECKRLIAGLGPENLDVLEISSGEAWKKIGFKSYTEANFPDFDICSDVLDRKFDLIIADQVFEHVLWPYRAGKNVLKMLKPGGYFLTITPFLIRVHEVPYDCSRWTETGMRHLLAECGFPIDEIKTASWGNLDCARATLSSWARIGWHSSLRNDRQFPVVVWALARNPFLP